MQDELEFFQSWWKILRKYWNPPGRHDHSKASVEFWEGLTKECLLLPKKYVNNTLFYPFANKMSLELVNEIARRAEAIHKSS